MSLVLVYFLGWGLLAGNILENASNGLEFDWLTCLVWPVFQKEVELTVYCCGFGGSTF
jgi:hypothetical protein